MSNWGQNNWPTWVLPHPEKEEEEEQQQQQQQQNCYSVNSIKSHSFNRSLTFSNLKLLITNTTFLGTESVPEVVY